ncbi:MAG: MBL fold metallo-hydrolase [Gemmatimonadales bacterium]
MTTLYALGSGSAGNAFAIATGTEALLVDAGFSAREITRRATAAGLDLRRLVGIVLTHEHGDHTAGVARLAQTLGIPVLASLGTWDRLRGKMPTVAFLPLAIMGGIRHGGFHIEACPTSHDAAEPVALSIRTAAGHRVAIAYDLGRPTTAVRYLLRESHAIVLEANHDDVLLRTSDYPPVVQERIAGSGGHLSNRAAAELLGDVLHAELQVVILAHLSARCNTSAEATAAMAPVLAGQTCQLFVAPQHEALQPIALR